MRRFCVPLIAASAFVAAAEAQTTHERSGVAVMVGSYVVKELGQGWQAPNFAYGASWDVPVFGTLGLRTTVGRVGQFVGGAGRTINTLDVTFLSLEARWRPHHTESGVLGVLRAGPALYNLRGSTAIYFSDGPWTSESTTNRLGWTAGAGLEFPLAAPRWYVAWDGNYHWPGGDGPSFPIVSLGVSWRY